MPSLWCIFVCAFYMAVLKASSSHTLRGASEGDTQAQPILSGLPGILVTSGLQPLKYHQGETWHVAQMGLK